MQNKWYISQILNFNGKYSDMAIYKTLEKFTSLGVAIFRVTLRDRTQIFLKKATIYENDMTQFVFIFSTRIKCEE